MRVKKAKRLVAYSTTGILGVDTGLLCAQRFNTPMFAPGIVTGMLIGLSLTFHLLPTVVEGLHTKRMEKADRKARVQSRHPSMRNRTKNIPNPRRGE